MNREQVIELAKKANIPADGYTELGKDVMNLFATLVCDSYKAELIAEVGGTLYARQDDLDLLETEGKSVFLLKGIKPFSDWVPLYTSDQVAMAEIKASESGYQRGYMDGMSKDTKRIFELENTVAELESEIENIKQVEFPKRIVNVTEALKKRITELEAAMIAKVGEQEPVATITEHIGFVEGIVIFDGVENMEQLPVGTKLYTNPPVQKQEPVKEQEPVGDMPHGWVVNWPSPNGGTKPVYHAGAIKPKFGTELDGTLTIYAVYTHPPAQQEQEPVDSAVKASAYMETKLWEFIDMAAAFPDAKPDQRTWNHVMVYAPVQESIQLLWNVRQALALSSAICDAVPSRDEGHLGKLVNAQPDGSHGYHVIHGALDELDAYLKTKEPVQEQEPDSDKVICPNCCHQFRAIPVNVQKLMLDAGFEPPFTEAPEQRQPLTDEQVETITNAAFEESAFMGSRAMSSTVVRMVERHHGIGVQK